MGRTHFTLNVPINVCNVDEAIGRCFVVYVSIMEKLHLIIKYYDYQTRLIRLKFSSLCAESPLKCSQAVSHEKMVRIIRICFSK